MDAHSREFTDPPPTKQQMLHGLYEDLRGCVQVVLGYSQLMLTKMDAGDPLRRYVQCVLEAAKYADERVAHLGRIGQEPLEPSKGGEA